MSTFFSEKEEEEKVVVEFEFEFEFEFEDSIVMTFVDRGEDDEEEDLGRGRGLLRWYFCSLASFCFKECLLDTPRGSSRSLGGTVRLANKGWDVEALDAAGTCICIGEEDVAVNMI